MRNVQSICNVGCAMGVGSVAFGVARARARVCVCECVWTWISIVHIICACACACVVYFQLLCCVFSTFECTIVHINAHQCSVLYLHQPSNGHTIWSESEARRGHRSTRPPPEHGSSDHSAENTHDRDAKHFHGVSAAAASAAPVTSTLLASCH
jgi:hypothetical protein